MASNFPKGSFVFLSSPVTLPVSPILHEEQGPIIIPGLVAVLMFIEVWTAIGLTPLWLLLSSAMAWAAATAGKKHSI